MKSWIPAILLWAALIFATACEPGERRPPRSVGATSEILVVTQNPEQWNGLQGETIRAYFGQFQYGLPQEEPLYKLVNITSDKLSDMFKKHRNIIIVESNPQLEEAVVETRNNLWSNPQRVIKITAPTAESWAAAFETNKTGFRILFDRTERERLMNIFRPTNNATLVEELYKHMGIQMIIPEGYFMAKKEPGFAWIRREAVDMSQALLIWEMPYRDTFDLNPARLLAVRDSITRKHIPGPTPGSFMSTDKEFVPPMVTYTDQFVTDYAVEQRGMWIVVGDFMGGPFVSYTVVNPITQKLLTVEGYVYAPNKDKRDLLRQLEALLFSLRFPVAEVENEVD